MNAVENGAETWAAVSAIVTGIGTIVALVALSWTVKSFKKELKFSHYSELERMYFDLVGMRITHRGIDKPASAGLAQHHGYGDYALLMWNFIEAIHDRCSTDPELMETWWPLLKYEAALHRKWFEANDHSYKEGFQDWVSEHFPIASYSSAASDP